MNTLYWHDYETWGADPTIDRPSQFAGVRTNENLDIVSEPLVVYCKPSIDVLPHPEACLVTGITPQKAMAEGVLEPEFIAAIHEELSQPGTCGVGYNSIRFDDEVTRFTLYRNFYDPYEREWKNGNGRWDIIDMLRFCYAVRPDGLEWPMLESGPSFKLELLTQANGIGHASAHDAYSDVEATINLARLVKSKQPGLYDYVYQHKHKSKVGALIDIRQRKPLLHISSRFPASQGCAALIAPICMHPTNKNAVIAFNLQSDPDLLNSLTAEEIRERVFSSEADLPEGVSRIPLKAIHLNKCPILATPKLLDKQAEERTGVDKSVCEKNWQKLLQMDVQEKIADVFSNPEFAPRLEVERQLYDGFIGPADKSLCTQVRHADASTLAARNFVFDDARLNTLLVRYKARHFPGSLSSEEESIWREFLLEKMQSGGEAGLSIAALETRISELKLERQSQRDIDILQALEKFVIDKKLEFENLLALETM